MKFNLVEKFFVLLFLFARFISFSQFFPSVIGGDSISYRLPPNTPIAELPAIFTYFPETLLGNSIRPFFPVSFFFFAGSDNKIVFFQSIFAILCWFIFLISLIFYTLKKNKLFFLWTRNANVSKNLIVKQTLFISIKTM